MGGETKLWLFATCVKYVEWCDIDKLFFSIITIFTIPMISKAQ